MLKNGILNDTALLEKGLSASWLRQETIMNNIANADTPNFKSSSVSFEEQMKSALDGSLTGKKTNERHIDIGAGNVDSVTPVVTQNDDYSWRMDENNVDIESEMTELARNTIYYTAISTKLSSQFGRLRTAIVEGGK